MSEIMLPLHLYIITLYTNTVILLIVTVLLIYTDLLTEDRTGKDELLK